MMIRKHPTKDWTFGWADWLGGEDVAGTPVAAAAPGPDDAPSRVASAVSLASTSSNGATAPPSSPARTLLEHIAEWRTPTKAPRERHFLHREELGLQPDFLGQDVCVVGSW